MAQTLSLKADETRLDRVNAEPDVAAVVHVPLSVAVRAKSSISFARHLLAAAGRPAMRPARTQAGRTHPKRLDSPRLLLVNWSMRRHAHLARQARQQDANERKRRHAHSHRRRAALVRRTQTEGHDRGQSRRGHADLGRSSSAAPTAAPVPLPPRASSPAISSPSDCPTAMRSSKPPLRCGSAARRRRRCRGGCRAAKPPRCSRFSSRRWWSAARPTGMRRIRCRPISCPKAFPTNR